jgi:hypothetical protein
MYHCILYIFSGTIVECTYCRKILHINSLPRYDVATIKNVQQFQKEQKLQRFILLPVKGKNTSRTVLAASLTSIYSDHLRDRYVIL